MMVAMVDDEVGAASAVADFHRARRRADVRSVLSLLSGQSQELIPFEEVRRRLHGVESAALTLEEVPLDAIVGSVGRYQDFTREFLPRIDQDRDRWVGVKLAMTGLRGVPPVDVYRLGDAYFVKDGNHRVSVARQLGARHIQAYVTPVHVRVPYSADDDPNDLIIKSEYAAFLEETGLDELRPGADLSLTVPGKYDALLEHIRVHRYFMGIDYDRPIDFAEAVAHWYDTVYLPAVEAIDVYGLLRGFEGRTVTDLYLFLSEHRGRLEQDFGWRLPSTAVAAGLGETRGLDPEARREELLEAARAEPARRRDTVRLVRDVLVLLRGAPSDAQVLGTALQVARHEGATLYALRVELGALEHEVLEDERRRFLAACEEAGVSGQFASSAGDPVREVRERAAYLDLVVAAMVDEADGERALAPALRGLLRRCPRPLLVVQGEPTAMELPLLAYDGGPKAEEALSALAYVALLRELRPVVMTVGEAARGLSPVLARARSYLERLGIGADYLSERGAVPEAILRTAREHGCDAIFMGSFKYNRWIEEVVGGILEKVLLGCRLPLLVT